MDADFSEMSDEAFAELRARLCESDVCIEHGRGTLGCPVPTEREQIDPDTRYTTGPNEADERLEAQSVPQDASCPDCGADPTAESIAKHRLSDNGYLHDDVAMVCAECDREWTHGVPIGRPDSADDLVCDSCGTRMLVHRVDLNAGQQEHVGLHLKCPNCYLFERTTRELGANNVALVGYPAITGNTDTDNDYGYPDDNPPVH